MENGRACTTNMYPSTVTIILLVALAAVAIASSKNENEQFDCQTNEKYYKCSLVKCPTSCDHLEYPKPCPLLSEDCHQPACECIEGYLRNGDGTCVLKENCFDSNKSHRVKKEVPESAEWEHIEL